MDQFWYEIEIIVSITDVRSPGISVAPLEKCSIRRVMSMTFKCRSSEAQRDEHGGYSPSSCQFLKIACFGVLNLRYQR